MTFDPRNPTKADPDVARRVANRMGLHTAQEWPGEPRYYCVDCGEDKKFNIDYPGQPCPYCGGRRLRQVVKKGSRIAQSWVRPDPGVAHMAVWFYHPGDPSPLAEITAELVVSPRKRAIGLSRHNMLHPMAGMLFLHPDGPSERHETFHVGGVKFPFDLVFIRRDHRIGKIIHDIQPDNLGRWGYPKTSAVIEVVGGFCESHGIGLGDHVGFGGLVRAQATDYCPYCRSSNIKVETTEIRFKCRDCHQSWSDQYGGDRRHAQLESGMAECRQCGWFASRDDFVSDESEPGCPDCGATDIKFARRRADIAKDVECLGCGWRTAEMDWQHEVEYCPRCGAELDAGMILPDGFDANAQLTVSEIPSAGPESSGAPTPDETGGGEWKKQKAQSGQCNKCGVTISMLEAMANRGRCPNCGNKVAQQQTHDLLRTVTEAATDSCDCGHPGSAHHEDGCEMCGCAEGTGSDSAATI